MQRAVQLKRSPYQQPQHDMILSQYVVSSWVSQLVYHRFAKSLDVILSSRQKYTFPSVTMNQYVDIINKRALCVTNDPKGRWSIGKPSIGAGMHQILHINSGARVRMI
jgi:hypothetical protein